MIPFLSCDWGTSSFRIHLTDPSNFQVLASQSSDQGTLKTYQRWVEAGSNESNRVATYLRVLGDHIQSMERAIGSSLDGTPVLISGMASSSIGMTPLPYRELPFATDGSDVASQFFPATEHFRHDVLLISGVRSEHDVMRGEETQLIGCIPPDLAEKAKTIFVFPGTHSKHITVLNGFATAFRTYMTGEYFDLLSTKSILAAGMQKGDEAVAGKGFEAGVKDAIGANLLHASFRARTNNLFGIFTAQENFSYLSGLLIGQELQELTGTDPNLIYLCCGTNLKGYYEKAFEILGLYNIRSFENKHVNEAVIKGQYLVYQKFKQHA